jgi:adenine phosphoribosyltransferase
MKMLEKLIRTIPDFPRKGIMFKDITPLLENGAEFKKVIDIFNDSLPAGINKLAAIESRGFIFAGALSQKTGIGFVPVRKEGKLPYKKVKVEYQLEYGTDILEMHTDGVKKGEKVVIIDDLLATGGTALATCQLIEKCGGKVEKIIFLIELEALGGRDKLKDYDVCSILKM